MNVFKLRRIFIKIFKMHDNRHFILSGFSYIVLATSLSKILMPKLFELEWILFIIYVGFFIYFLVINYFIRYNQKLTTAWYWLLVVKHKADSYCNNEDFKRIYRLLINLNQHDNVKMQQSYNESEQNLVYAFSTLIVFAFFVIFIKVEFVEWLMWSIAIVVEIYFKISLHSNAIINKLIKWTLFKSDHLLFFKKNNSEINDSALIVKKLINAKMIKHIFAKISKKYDIKVSDIEEQLLFNYKTSHHFNNYQKPVKLVSNTTINELLNFEHKKLLKYYNNSNYFFKVIAHKLH